VTDAPGRLAILTSGGDAPGMNAAIRVATLFALARGWTVHGVSDGYRGLVEGKLTPLEATDVSGIIREGGTILGSARCLEFMERPARDAARARLREHRIDGLLVIGGNGSLAGAAALSDPAEAGDAKTRVIGLPASIDNDIGMTGLALGVDTAMNTIVEACDKLSDTASALHRTFLIEVMGRSCGYLAMTSAISSGADAILFPEAARSEAEIVETVVRTIRAVRARPGHRNRVLVIKAEGVAVPTERLKTLVDAQLRDVGDERAAVETRVTVLGHVVRGGRPSAFDRLLASRLAHVALRAIFAGEHRRMAAWMLPLEPPAAVARRSADDPYCWLVDLEAVLAETQRMLAGTSPLVQWRARVLKEIEDVLSL
jgi:6-phosphofructokinase 1